MEKLLQRYRGFYPGAFTYHISIDTVRALASGLQMVHEDNLRRCYSRDSRKLLRAQYNKCVVRLKELRDMLRAKEWFARNYRGKKIRLGNRIYMVSVLTGMIEEDGFILCPVTWEQIRSGTVNVEVVDG